MLLLCANVSLGVFTCAKQLFMNELKLKMAVDARRKWLPREKVMPGKPGGDDGDAHTADQSESSPSPPVQWSGTALPPMGVSRVWQGTVCTGQVSLGLYAAYRASIFFIIVSGSNVSLSEICIKKYHRHERFSSCQIMLIFIVYYILFYHTHTF